MKKKVTALILALIMLLAFAACGSSGSGTANQANTGSAAEFKPVVLKFANQHPSDSTASDSDRKICEKIAAATEGRVTVELYTDSSLGDYTSTVQELMMGTIQMCHITAPDNYDARMTCSMLPYLGSNFDELRVLYDPDGYLVKSIKEAALAYNLHSFGIYCEGFSGVGIAHEISNANSSNTDKNSLVRVPSVDNFALAARQLGFKTSTIAYADTYTAIQTGTVHGWVGGPPNLNYLYFRDVIKYYYHYMLTQEATQIIMNEQIFQSLLPEDQVAITKIIEEECAASFDLAAKDDEEYMKQMADMGIVIVEFTDEERALMAADVRANVWPELAKNMGGQEHLDKILAMLE